MSASDERFSFLEKDVKDIKLTLENVTNKNIRIIAEAHLDLSRKLDKALMIENERELLSVRMNVLEDEVRKLIEHQTA